MAELLIPGFKQVNLGINGGVYDETKNPKGCIHTTEGYTLESAESAYREYPPHIGYDPVRRIKHQYIPLNKHSYAFRGTENDDEYVIQIEIVGFASQTHTWRDDIYNNIAEDIIEPLEKAVEIPRVFLRFYGEDDGVILASKDSPIRLSNGEFRSYSGWLGHQHVPAPDTHWDPGKFLIAKCFKYLSTQNTVEDDMFTDKDREKLDHLFEMYRKGEAKKWSQGEMNNYIMKIYRGDHPAFQKLVDKIKTFFS